MHPSMIMPEVLSVVEREVVEKEEHLIRAPHINFNRTLPGTWSEEMTLRLDKIDKTLEKGDFNRLRGQTKVLD